MYKTFGELQNDINRTKIPEYKVKDIYSNTDDIQNKKYRYKEHMIPVYKKKRLVKIYGVLLCGFLCILVL